MLSFKQVNSLVKALKLNLNEIVLFICKIKISNIVSGYIQKQYVEKKEKEKPIMIAKNKIKKKYVEIRLYES